MENLGPSAYPILTPEGSRSVSSASTEISWLPICKDDALKYISLTFFEADPISKVSDA